MPPKVVSAFDAIDQEEIDVISQIRATLDEDPDVLNALMEPGTNEVIDAEFGRRKPAAYSADGAAVLTAST